MAIELNTTIARVEGAQSAAVDQDLVILNLATSHYVALDAIGRRIWELLEEPRRVEDLCRQLSLEFDAAPDQIAADVLPFLEQLRDENLAREA